jgi:hypothetical protein
MPVTLDKLKEVPQGSWLGELGYSTDGVCFYMSDWVDKNTWVKGNYLACVATSRTAIPATIMKAAKAKNLADRTRSVMLGLNGTFTDITLAANTIYRVNLWFGTAPAPGPGIDGVNHSAIAATGPAGKVLFFEPNFGFYIASQAGQTYNTVLQSAIELLYNPTGTTVNPDIATNFIYLAGRKL